MWGKSRIAGLLVMAISLAGCASIVGKNMYPVTINSHPDDATIVITDENGKQMYKGKTPTTITLSSGEAYFHPKRYTITFSRDGYEDQTTEIKAGISGWYFGNIIFGGLIGLLIVDPLTGKMWNLPTETTVNLAEKVASNNTGDRTLRIASIANLSESERKRLVRIN